jgi:hypothetical protein
VRVTVKVPAVVFTTTLTFTLARFAFLRSSFGLCALRPARALRLSTNSWTPVTRTPARGVAPIA